MNYLGHPQPPQRTGHGCTVGVNRDPPAWPSTQAGWRRNQSASLTYVERHATIFEETWIIDVYSCSLPKNVRDASSEHDTIRQTTWHNSSSRDAVFCRNRPPKTPRRNDSETMCAVVSLAKSPSPLAELGTSSLSNSPDFRPTTVSLAGRADDSASFFGNFWPNWTSSSLSLCVRPLAAPYILPDVLVGKTPVISSAHREVTTSTHCYTTSSHATMNTRNAL